jgi:hypothetical protein
MTSHVGLFNFKRSMAMRFNAVLSKTTTQSAFSATLFRMDLLDFGEVHSPF